MANEKMEAALKYAAMGWRVFRLSPNSKVPISGTNGVKDATTDEATIRAWWSTTPDANIGLACGAGSGVWVVDLDVRPARGVDGRESVKDVEIPATLMQDTPSGGVHLLFGCSGEPPANRNALRPGVDIRGDGYYIVLAPSTYNGVAYSWRNWGSALAEYPEALKPAREPAPLFPWATRTVSEAERTVTAAPAETRGPTKLERASLYLATVDGAVQGAGGHDTLLRAATDMVVGFDLTEAEALRLLWDEYNPRCSPPWDPSSRKDVRDFERKVSEAAKNKLGKPVGWLLEQENPTFAENAALEALGDAFAAGLEDTAEGVADASTGGEPASPVEAVADATPWTDELLYPSGLVGDIARWMQESAGCPQPILNLGAALVLCGSVFGRKVKDESNGRTNLYAMGIGESSAGKDHPGRCILRILQAAKADALLGGEVSSDSAIEKCLADSPTKLFVMDEIGHFYRTINSSSKNSPHLQTIIPTFMKLFSAASTLYVGKQLRDGDARKIDQPCVSMWGVTTPDIVFENMTREELRGGWTARNLVFITHDQPVYRFTRECPVPESISTTVSAWFRRSVSAPDGTGNLLAAMTPQQIVVPTTPEAYRILDDFNVRARSRYQRLMKAEDKCAYLWGKALENARRVALIVACGERYDGAEIGAYEAGYAVKLIETLLRSMSSEVGNRVAENEWERMKKRIVKIVEDSGPSGITQNALTRRTQFIKDQRTRMGYVSDLVEAGLVFRIVTRTSAGGRPLTVLKAAIHLTKAEKEGME